MLLNNRILPLMCNFFFIAILRVRVSPKIPVPNEAYVLNSYKYILLLIVNNDACGSYE